MDNLDCVDVLEHTRYTGDILYKSKSRGLRENFVKGFIIFLLILTVKNEILNSKNEQITIK